MNKLKNTTLEYLASINTMQVATCDKNTPWCSNVYFAFDERLAIYFISRPTRKHSEDIRNNPKIALGFCKEHESPFNMPNRGIQASGECQEIEHDHLEFQKLKEIYLGRFPAATKMFESHFIYKITLEKVILFDEVNYPEEPWQTLNITNS